MAAAAYQQDLLDTFACYGAVLEKTAALVQAQTSQEEKVAKLIPLAVQALLDNERIEPTQKEAAVAALKDPARVLEILIKTAHHRSRTEQSHLGHPVDPKTKQGSSKNGSASSNGKPNSLSDPWVGRRTGQRKESDVAFLSRLGVEPQDN